jgi:hypothetical protein
MPISLATHRRPQQAELALEFADVRPVELPPALRMLGDETFGPVPTPRAALPPVAQWSARLCVAIAEVLAGTRPAAQLSRWVSLPVALGLQSRAISSAGARGQRRITPTLHALRLTEPADGVAEVAAVVRTGTRPVVLAIRLEGLDGRWICVEVGTPDGWRVGGLEDDALDQDGWDEAA